MRKYGFNVSMTDNLKKAQLMWTDIQDCSMDRAWMTTALILSAITHHLHFYHKNCLFHKNKLACIWSCISILLGLLIWVFKLNISQKRNCLFGSHWRADWLLKEVAFTFFWVYCWMVADITKFICARCC